MGLNALISRNNHEVKSVTSKCICSREDESRHLVESLVDPVIGSEVKAVFLLVIWRRSIASKCPKSGQYSMPLSKRVSLTIKFLGVGILCVQEKAKCFQPLFRLTVGRDN